MKNKKIFLTIGFFFLSILFFYGFTENKSNFYPVKSIPVGYTEYQALSQEGEILSFVCNNGDSIFIQIDYKYLDTNFDNNKEKFFRVRLFNNE